MTKAAEAEQSGASVQESPWHHVVDLLAEDERPIEVGQYEVCAQGRLTRRRFDLPLEFSFVYDGDRFDCRVDLSKEKAVGLRARLARLPFTAESPAGRARALRLLSAKGLQSSGKLTLSEGGWIDYEGHKAPPRPCTPACVLSSVAALVLELKPLAQLLRHAIEPTWTRPRAS